MNKNNNELTAFVVQKEFQKNGFDAGIHTIYVGEVIVAWKR